MRIVGQDGQRCLQPVGHVRGVRPRPLDRRILHVQQAVDLGGKRLDLIRKVCPQPRRGAGADRREPTADRIEWPQADPHLHPGGGDENGGENSERGRQFAGEGATRNMNFTTVDGDGGPDRAAAELCGRATSRSKTRSVAPPGPAVM